jgi:hypothetical protein
MDRGKTVYLPPLSGSGGYKYSTESTSALTNSEETTDSIIFKML